MQCHCHPVMDHACCAVCANVCRIGTSVTHGQCVTISHNITSTHSYWVGRAGLVIAVIVLGYRSYWDSIVGFIGGPDPTQDIVITYSEFIPQGNGNEPLWIIRLRNNSSDTTYDEIVLNATYMNNRNEIVETDQIIIKQRLNPKNEEEIPSRDPKIRDTAATAKIEILDAKIIEP